MEHHGTVGRKECYYIFSYILFWRFCVFAILVTFIDEVSNLHNRILTNQKPELVIRKCQWN